MQPETSEGEVLLSLDRARGEKGWRTAPDAVRERRELRGRSNRLQQGRPPGQRRRRCRLRAAVAARGPAPGAQRHSGAGLRPPSARALRLKVIELNRRRNRVILSERGALQEWRSQQKDRLLSELEEGEVRKGRISSIRSFGVFVDLGGADGLVHLSEISWDRTKAPEELFNVGDEVDVYVMKVDAEKKKIALSIRRAQPAHWDGIVDKYQVGEVVPGIVTKLATFGAFARIEGPVEGLIHVSELVDRRIAHSQEAVREGDILPLKIIRIERDRHRLGLSLKQARDRGEIMGFAFSPDGEVIYVPEEIREAFQDEVKAADAPSAPKRGETDERADDRERGEPVAAAAPAARSEAARRRLRRPQKPPSSRPFRNARKRTTCRRPRWRPRSRR